MDTDGISMSTGGAATNAMMYTDTAVNNVGIMITPNQPMYKRFSVDVIKSQKRAQSEVVGRRSITAVMRFRLIKRKNNFHLITPRTR